MGFDGFLVPDWAKPWVGWAVGMDWPEGDESGCFRLADACAATARNVATGGPQGGLGTMKAARPDADWDGDALKAFADHVRQVSGGKQADLVDRLVAAALEFNRVGVQVEYTKRMIEVSVWFLIFQLIWLLAAAAGPWGGVSLALIGARAQLTRMTIRQIAKRLLFNIALFGGVMGGLDLGVQASQSRRDSIDWDQVLASAGTGALTGVFLTGISGSLSRLSTAGLQAGLSRAEMSALEKTLVASSRSMWGLMGQSGLANGAATAVSLGMSGRFDWETVLKGTTAGMLGGADAHWAGGNPFSRGGDGGPGGESATNLAHAVPDGTVRPDAAKPEGVTPRADGSSPGPAPVSHQAPARSGGEQGARQAAPSASGGRAGDGSGQGRSGIDRIINWDDSPGETPEASAPHGEEAADRTDGGAADTRDAVTGDTDGGGHNGAAEPPHFSPEQLQALTEVEAEARQILAERLGDSAPVIDYTSAPIHPDVAREYNRVLEQVADRFPAALSEVGTISTADPKNRFVNSVGAYSVLRGPDTGIYLNAVQLRDLHQVTDLYATRMQAGWLSRGYEDPGAVLYHELGHHLLERLPDSVEQKLMQEIREVIGRRVAVDVEFRPEIAQIVERELSRYGATDPYEMVAEAFAEYMGAGTPRMLALAIGTVLQSHYWPAGNGG